MICADLASTVPRPLMRSRGRLAAQRAGEARTALADCQLCHHRCRVNRLAGEQGRCKAGVAARVFSAQTELGDELELLPTFAIALAGCDLRCAFCVTGGNSWHASQGQPVDASALAARAVDALADGAKTVMMLGGEPTIHLPTVLEIVAELPDAAVLVWKTNAHGTAEARALLQGMFDVWVADYKFGNDACARRLARVPDYSKRVQENLAWAAVQGDLIVRHLLMPGHVECCWRPVARWLAENLRRVRVSLRTGFWPAWQARRHAEMGAPSTAAETQRALDIARACGLNLIP